MNVTYEMSSYSNLNETYVVSAKNCKDVIEELNRPRILQTRWGTVDKEANAWAKFHFTFLTHKFWEDPLTRLVYEVTIYESIGIFYPKWKELSRQPSVIQENWKEMLRQCKKHEEGIHWELYRKKKKEVENFLSSQMEYTPRDLKRYLEEVDKQHLKEQVIAHEKLPLIKLDCI